MLYDDISKWNTQLSYLQQSFYRYIFRYVYNFFNSDYFLKNASHLQLEKYGGKEETNSICWQQQKH